MVLALFHAKHVVLRLILGPTLHFPVQKTSISFHESHMYTISNDLTKNIFNYLLLHIYNFSIAWEPKIFLMNQNEIKNNNLIVKTCNYLLIKAVCIPYSHAWGLFPLHNKTRVIFVVLKQAGICRSPRLPECL